jgi:GntR family transcriptional regulator, histidine utilization repressor
MYLETHTRKIDDTPLPLYQKLKNLIIARIRSGEWEVGQQIPSETDFVEQYSISRMTANRALRELTAGGYLVRVQGVGTFVARPKPAADILKIRSIADEINEQGGIYSNRVECLAHEDPLDVLTEEMGLGNGRKIFHSVLIHMDRGLPIQLEDRYVNPDIVPDYLKQDFSRITPTEYLLKIVAPTEVEHLLEAILPDKRTKRLLKIGPAEPCLSLRRRTWSGNRVVTRARLIYPGSRYQIGGRFRPGEPDPSGADWPGISYT